MRDIAEPAYPDEDGQPDTAVLTALLDYQAGKNSYQQVVAALQDSRLLVPVVAILGEVEYDEQGFARDKTSQMAAVLLTGRDGRTGLLAFTSMETMLAWNPQARPVPVPVRQAAAAALDDGATAVVIDVAGPHTFVLETEEIQSLAGGLSLRQVYYSENQKWAWTRPM